MRMGFNPHGRAIEELLKHLDKSDDDDLGMAIKPKGPGVEVMKVEAMPGDGDKSPGVSDQDVGMDDGTTESGDGQKLSEEEIAELIEALQSKLG